MAKRNSLGKGLDALFIDNNTEDGAITTLRISELEPNKGQPRTTFDDQALSELADSLREHGVLQPLVVRPMEKGGYQIVAGERRWRAARMVGLSELPVVIRELDDQQTLQIAIIENLQREDLNLMELALGYQALMKQYNMTQEQVAAKVGKSRSVVANTIRLLALPDSVQRMVQEGSLSFGHARALLALEDTKLLTDTAQKVIKDGILVRDIEKLARDQKQKAENALLGIDDENKNSNRLEKDSDPFWGDSYYREMELALSSELGRKVKITAHGKHSTIELDFYNNEELADIAARLTKSKW